jgi:hypothetical protein
MAKKSRYRYEFSWVDHNNYEVTKYVVAITKKEAVEKFQEQLETAGKEIPVGYTVKSTFLIV